MMSTDTKANLPFDERNQQDFMLVTKRIQDALELMANDRGEVRGCVLVNPALSEVTPRAHPHA